MIMVIITSDAWSTVAIRHTHGGSVAARIRRASSIDLYLWAERPGIQPNGIGKGYLSILSYT
jgi:hypothetical protein